MTVPRPSSGPRRVLQLPVTLAAGAAVLVATGPSLPFPTDHHPGDLPRWLDAVGPAVATFTLLRAVAMVLLTWGFAVTALTVVAHRCHLRRTAGVLERAMPRRLRVGARSLAGVVVVGSTMTPGLAGATPATMVPLERATARPATVAMHDLGATPSPAAPAVMHALDDEVTPPLPTNESRATWVIGAGDTLWHVAEATAADRLGRPATAVEITELLTELVAANRDQLALPGDPGLVFPGQVIVLP